MTFSELVDRFRSEIMPTLTSGTRAAYEDTLKPASEFFAHRLRDPFLEKIRKRHINDYLSWRRVHRRDGSEPLSGRTLEKDRAVLHRHDLRHRRVTEWLGDGKSAALVQEAMGHSDLRTTMEYKHLAKSHLRALVVDPDEQGRDERRESNA